jgi:hypothetical protein
MSGPRGTLALVPMMPLVNIVLVPVTSQSSLLPVLPHVISMMSAGRHVDIIIDFCQLTCGPFRFLGKWLECDNSRIQSPFEKVNIWPESVRRDGHNGIGFIQFQEISFFSLF